MPRWVKVERYRFFPIIGLSIDSREQMLNWLVTELVRKSVIAAGDLNNAYLSKDKTELYVRSSSFSSIPLYSDEIRELVPLIKK